MANENGTLVTDEIELVVPVRKGDLNQDGTSQKDRAETPEERLQREKELWMSGQAVNLDEMILGGWNVQDTRENDIVEWVARNFPGGFDLKGARKAGFTNTEILSRLTGSSPAGKLQAFTESATRGALEFGPASAGLLSGFKLGLATGPAAWWASPLFALGLGAYGLWAGKEAADVLVPRQGPYSPSSRASAEAGTTFGSGASTLWFGPAALGRNPNMFPQYSLLDNVAKLNGRNETVLKNAQFIRDSLRQFTKDNPKLAFTTEASGITGASFGAYLAENTNPGDLLFRLTSEVGFGVAHPAILLQSAYRSISPKLGGLGGTFTKKGRNTRQYKAIADFLGRDNLEQVLRDLNNPTELQKLAEAMDISQMQFGPVPLDRRASEQIKGLTTAQLIDNPRLNALQNSLASDPAFSGKMKEYMRQGYDGISNLITMMANSGDPVLLNQAYVLKKDFMNSLILRRLDDINAKVIRVNSKIAPNDPRAAMKAGRVIEEATNDALLNLRQQESDLYDLVDQNELMNAENFIKTISENEGSLDILPISGRKIYYNSTVDLNEDAVNEVRRLIERENKKIDNAESIISSIESKYPGYGEEVNGILKDSGTPEESLARIQNILGNFDGFAVNYTGASKTRLKRVLENKAVMLDAEIKKSDLQNQLKVNPDDFVNEVTLRDMMDARKRILARIRSAKSAKDFDQAHTLSDLLSALDDDIGAKAYAGNLDYSDLSENQRRLRDAYDYSKQFNDIVTRAFPQEVLNVSKTGARRVQPELLSTKLFSGGGDALSLRYDDLTRAINSMEGGENLSNTLGNMLGAQEDLLRVAFEKIIDPRTGRVDPGALANFNKNYRNVLYKEDGLPRFPDLINDLADAESAQRLLDTRVEKVGYPSSPLRKIKVGNSEYVVGNFPKGSVLEQKVKNQLSFYEALNDAKASDQNAYIANKFVGEFLPEPNARELSNKRDPEKGFSRLIQVTKRLDAKHPGASLGLRDLILDRAMEFGRRQDATGKDVLDFNLINKYLYSPLDGAKGASPMEIMRREGLIDTGFSFRLDKVLTDGMRYQTQLANAAKGKATAEKVPMPIVERLLFRVLALRAGKKIERLFPGSGQGLAEPGIFGELTGIEQQFVRVPNMLSADLLLQLAKDPMFFKEVMSATPNQPRLELMKVNRIHNYLINAGFLGVRSERSIDAKKEKLEKEKLEKEKTQIDLQQELVPPFFGASLDRTPAAPTVAGAAAPRPAPFVVAQAPVASPPPAQQARPADRSRFAAAFPSDITAPFIKQQGIETLLT